MRIVIFSLLFLVTQFLSAQYFVFQPEEDEVQMQSVEADNDDGDADADSVANADDITIEEDTTDVDSVIELPWPQSMQVALERAIYKSALTKHSFIGMQVYDLTADSVIFAYNDNITMRPASTMKVLTAVTALDKLGGAYRYKTRLCYTGEIIDSTSVLDGDIYLVGGMDPKITREDLKAFASAIHSLGIDTINGNVYADRSMKDDKLLGEGWCWDDDNPELSPLVYYKKDNMMKSFMDVLESSGIYVDGEQKTKTLPRGAKEIAVRTHTIEQILQRMMKNSDNLYAESMFYQIALSQGKPATAKKAASVMKALTKKMHMDNVPARFADGSGLSLYDYVSPALEVAFLKYAYENRNIYEYLRPSLPIAGVDGTLKSRMAGTPAYRNVRAKTGTVSSISALAGYCTASNGHQLCFSIINQGMLSSSPARAMQDRLCAIMCK